MFQTRTTLFAAASALALAACTPTSTTTDNPRQRTGEGAAIGALLGGVTGAIVGDDTRSAVIGAVAGGVIGGAIGYNLDQQAAELQRDLGNGRIQIINNGDFLVVRMPDDILFDVDSAVVKPTLRADLTTLAANLQRYPDSTIQVVGHTDNTGTADYNQGLSERRAGAVASVLIGAGVNAGRIAATGVGETQPLATNATPEGRAQNRRVDITIRPNRR